MNDRYTAYLKTDAWREISRLCRERAGYRCQVCNSPERLQAHHRTYVHFGRERDHLGDLTCLCHTCHTFYHKVIQPGRAATQVKNFTDHQRAATERRRRERKKWKAVKQKRKARGSTQPRSDTETLEDVITEMLGEEPV